MIDKHAAHERIIFEDLKKNLSLKEPSSQVLMLPIVTHLNNEELVALHQFGDEIKKIDGFPVALAHELKHCILAHHGELEYGSPKKPALVEALCLSFADNLDAKMETMKELLAGIPDNNLEWQGYNRMLETNFRKTS
jgi:hypothetical protein